MKRCFSLFLATIMIFSLAGCSNKEAVNNETTKDEVESLVEEMQDYTESISDIVEEAKNEAEEKIEKVVFEENIWVSDTTLENLASMDEWVEVEINNTDAGQIEYIGVKIDEFIRGEEAVEQVKKYKGSKYTELPEHLEYAVFTLKLDLAKYTNYGFFANMMTEFEICSMGEFDLESVNGDKNLPFAHFSTMGNSLSNEIEPGEQYAYVKVYGPIFKGNNNKDPYAIVNFLNEYEESYIELNLNDSSNVEISEVNNLVDSPVEGEVVSELESDL